MGPASRVVNQYLEAFWSGDFETARRLVADAFSFQGPFLQTDDERAPDLPLPARTRHAQLTWPAVVSLIREL
jgi:hypothetical protein